MRRLCQWTSMILIALAASITCRHAYAAGEDPLFRLVNVETTAGLEIGRGYDLLAGKPRADCVDRSVVENHPDFGPNSVAFHSVRIENSGQLDRALGVSASASLSTGYGSGSASASYSTSLSISSYSLNYLVETVVNAKGDSIRDAKLKPQYRVLIVKGDDAALDRFHTICGDGYIGEFVMGGAFQALIQIHTRSKAESESLAATATAAFSMASGSASFSSVVKDIAKNNDVRIWSLERGGGGAVAITPEDIAAKASTLPDLVKKWPTPSQAAIFSYILLLEDPSLPLIDFTTRETALSLLENLSERARDQQADAQYILDHPTEFYSSPPDLPALAMEIKELEDLQTVIRAKADACVKGAGSCETVDPILPSPTARPAQR
jgi:hypothetical protein